MRSQLALTSIVLSASLIATPSAAKAQPPADSATMQIRRTTFAPWLHVNLQFSFQTWSGTFVRDIFPGDGRPQGISSKVGLRIHFWLADGTPIINPTETVRFIVGRGMLIRGIEEGVVGMRLGGVRQLVIPSVAGWGLSGHDAIPPNAVLVAEIALIEVAYDAQPVAR